MSKHKSELKIPLELSKKTREAHSFENMTFPPVSVAKLCDDGCMVIFDKKKASVMHKGKVTKEAPRQHVKVVDNEFAKSE